jgi:uncharacterized protein (DUF983 family)
VTKATFSNCIGAHLLESQRNGRAAFIIFLIGCAVSIGSYFMLEAVIPKWSPLVTLGVIVISVSIGTVYFNKQQRKSIMRHGLRCERCGGDAVPISLAIKILSSGICPHCGTTMLTDVSPSSRI